MAAGWAAVSAPRALGERPQRGLSAAHSEPQLGQPSGQSAGPQLPAEALPPPGTACQAAPRSPHRPRKGGAGPDARGAGHQGRDGLPGGLRIATKAQQRCSIHGAGPAAHGGHGAIQRAISRERLQLAVPLGGGDLQGAAGLASSTAADAKT